LESFNKHYRNNATEVGIHSRDMSEYSSIPQQQEIQEKVTGQINHAIDATSQKLNQLAEKIENTSQDSRSSVGQTVHKVADQVRRGADTLQATSAEELGEQMQRMVRERPLTSLGIAFSVGFLLSQLLKR
jgi:ElaB/YqjD/DUF883 family membrane-anchored ribosome-binding protein